MPISDFHRRYLDRQGQWNLLTDTLEGRDAIIAAGTRYVPMLSGQKTHVEYLDYLRRGMWYGATAKTAQAFTGQIFRRDPVVVLSRRLEERENNINAAGESLFTFSREATYEVLTKGRYGLLVDISRDGSDPPYIAGYTTENIRNWRERIVNGRPKLDQVILSEEMSQPSADGFGSTDEVIYRVLELDADGLYRIRIFASVEASGIVQVDEIIPRPKDGKRIDYIPFVPVGSKNLRITPDRPPMLDMAEANIAHWLASVDLAAGLHKTAFPVPVISGVDPDSQAVWEVGGDNVWLLPMGASASMLEFRGDGLGALERQLERCERYMAKLGATMLEDKKRVTETAEALNVRNSGENATLADVAESAGTGLTRALEFAADWVGDDPGKIQCLLNKDFEASGMPPQDLLALITGVQQGVIPLDDYIWNLQRREVLRPGRSVEEVRNDLETQKPVLAGAPDDLTQSAPGGIQTGVRAPRSPDGSVPSQPNANVRKPRNER